ncbi:TPA: hypothetical protein ACPWRS_006300, partial [Pseudomonas aeruginosa]
GKDMKNLRIWWLKRRLRGAYLTYISMLDSHSCGRHIAEQMPSVASQRERCNRLLAKLAHLDANAVPFTSIS